jgi:uncharacterized membrane protein YhhN
VSVTTAALLAVTGVAAVACWFSVIRSLSALEYATKPAVMLGLIAVAVALHPASATQRAFFVAALALGLASDVFLMLPRDLFLAGLVAALAEHVLYIAGFLARPPNVLWLAAAAAIALGSVAAFLPPIIRALRRRHPSLVGPVVLYVAVFVVMVVRAGATGSAVALAGALLFFYSDAILAWNRFVRPVRFGRVVNLVPYHAGQALLVLSLIS